MTAFKEAAESEVYRLSQKDATTRGELIVSQNSMKDIWAVRENRAANGIRTTRLR
jgi:hypothetical protein